MGGEDEDAVAARLDSAAAVLLHRTLEQYFGLGSERQADGLVDVPRHAAAGRHGAAGQRWKSRLSGCDHDEESGGVIVER